MDRSIGLFLRYVIYLAVYGCLVPACNSNRTGEYGNRKKSTTDSIPPIVQIKPNFHIYMENSASMDGYIAKESDFKNDVYGIITDIKAKDIGKNINLYYINDTICPFKSNALPADIQYFIKELNPQTLRNNGCKRTTSYLPDIINEVISHNKNDVSILVSDFIFSTGKGGSTNFLTQQQHSIELLVSGELRKHDFSTIILKMNSEFNGIYFVESISKKVDLSGKNIRRPYYIMIFGNQQSLQGTLSKLHFNDYRGFENSLYLLTPSTLQPKAKIIRHKKIGDFEIAQPASALTITNAEAGDNPSSVNAFQFSVAMDLSYLQMEESYLSDPGNYHLPANYKIVSIEKNTDETNEGLKGFTHVVTVATQDLKTNQDISIKFKSGLPYWLTRSSNIDDSDPLDPIQQKQTFGFKYLVQGIAEGYMDTYPGKDLFGIVIHVTTAKGVGSSGKSSGFRWPIVVLIFLIVGGIVWIKNKNR